MQSLVGEPRRRGRRSALPLALVAAVLMALAAPAAHAGWSLAGVPDVVQSGAALAQLDDGRVLIAGGQSEFGEALTTVSLYDPRRETYAAAPPLAEGRYRASAVRLVDGRIAVFGGLANGCALVRSSVEIYDPATDRWGAPIQAPTGAGTDASVALADGRVLVVSGACDRDAYVFDPSDESFELVPTEMAYSPGIARLGDGRVLVAGGCCTTALERSAQIFDPVTSSWTPASPLNRPRHASSSSPLVTLPDGRAFMTSGWADDSETFDPATGRWTLTPPSPLGVQASTQAVLPDGRVLVIGLYGGRAATWDPIAESWETVDDGPDMELAGEAFEADGAIYVVSGTRPVVRWHPEGPDGDITAPELVCDGSDDAWWFEHNVTITCTASDAESGLADPADAFHVFRTDVPPGSGERFDFRHEVCDRVGNCSVVQRHFAVEIPASPITLDFAHAPGSRTGWWTVSSVATQMTATGEQLSSIACSVDGVAKTFAVTRTATTLGGQYLVTGEGRHVTGCTVTSRPGVVASETREVNIDLKPPTRPLASAERAPEYAGGGGWYRDRVTVGFRDTGDPPLADGSAGSGVDPASVPEAQTFSGSGVFTASGTVADVAGRTSLARTLTVRVDADPPQTTLACPTEPVTLGSRATARWTAADAHSGVAVASGTLALDTTALGRHEASRVATDRVGHTAQASCTYAVVYPFTLAAGLLAPPELNAVAPGVSTVAVAFSLGGDRGTAVLDQARVQPLVCLGGMPAGPAFPAAASAPPTYAAGTRRYAYAWQLDDDLPPGTCAALLLDLADGTTREIRFAR